jgi:hypothetical protein
MCKIKLEALQEIRIKYRQSHWSEKMKAESQKKKFEPYVLTNDTLKQLLARSRYFYTKQIKVV